MKQTPTKSPDEKPIEANLLDDAPDSITIAGQIIDSTVEKMLDLAWEKDILKRHLKQYNVSFV